MYVTYKIERYKRNDDGTFSTDPFILTDYYNLRVRLGIDNVKNTFSFSVNNNYNKYFNNFNVFENGDRIKIYGGVNTSLLVTSDLLIDAVIDGISETQAETNTIIISGADRTEQLLQGLAFVDTNTTKTPAEILESALNFHNSQNTNFQITWDSNNPITSSTPGKKEDGTDFPAHYATEFYKPMNLLFERYSSNEYTKDGNYYYYLVDNTLKWAKRLKETTGSLNETDCESLSITNKTKNLVNSLVVYCGINAKNVGIRAYVFDDAGKVKNGTKWKFITSTNSIGTTIMQNEINTNPTDFDVTSYGWFPKPGSYPYTPTWGSSVADDDEYNQSVINEAIRRGKEQGKAYLDKIKVELISATITLPLTFDYTIGQLLNCNFPTYGLTNKPLRIQDITYSDYTTTLKLKEDELN